MRKTTLGLLVLAALLVCCLIAGTPVNNDGSDAAVSAGIHLATPPSAAQAASSHTAPVIAAFIVSMVVLLGGRLTELRVNLDRAIPAMRSKLRARTGQRRGPPLLAI